MSKKAITSLKQLKMYAKGEIVELPPFAEGQPFVARLRRPSLIKLVSSGTIPNDLIVKANDLFMTGGSKLPVADEKLLSDLSRILNVVAETSFVEPSYEEIKESGVELTDEQLMFIFNYSQKGVLMLESFRTESEDRNDFSAVEEV